MRILCKDIDEKTLQQAYNLDLHPRLYDEVVIMPDAHCGYGMPIGGVCYLQKAISPNMVGADIGCGVMSVKTNFTTSDITTEKLKLVMSKIREKVPMGFNWRKERLIETLSFLKNKAYSETLYNDTMLQLGTLGGGNHFIEIQKDEENNIWFMIHCGSRNLGKKIGDYYNDLAKEQCLAREEEHLVKQELTYLMQGTKAFKDYVNDMKTAVKFASTNRNFIAEEINKAFKEVYPNYEELDRIDCKHNYAEYKEIEGKDVYLHRKGAVSIEYNKLALIAGSQGSKSYMVQATDKAVETYWTCSHGAGRKLSRTKAKTELDLNTEIKLLEDQGIIGSIRTTNDLEEASGAYKDIESVIEQQKEYIKIIHTFKPLGVLKVN